jgi:Ca2+-binding EF-hand superfamily protein
MRWLPRIALLATMTTLLAAQTEPSPKKRPEAQGPGRATADVYSEARSREMFTACDGNSDDRLDLFEACEAIESLGDPKDGKAFQRLDRDRDGFLAWPEFDQHFKSVAKAGGTFRVRTCRRLVQQAPEQQQARPATPMQKFLKLYDGNGNGGLDPDEIDQLVVQVGLPPAVGTQLRGLDLDNSGRVEETELAAGIELVRGSFPLLVAAANKPATTLPAPWGSIDENGDQEITLEELTAALRRLDPGLARWAEYLMRRFDHDKNGKLTADELPVAPTATPGTKTAAGPARAQPLAERGDVAANRARL